MPPIVPFPFLTFLFFLYTFPSLLSPSFSLLSQVFFPYHLFPLFSLFLTSVFSLFPLFLLTFFIIFLVSLVSLGLLSILPSPSSISFLPFFTVAPPSLLSLSFLPSHFSPSVEHTMSNKLYARTCINVQVKFRCKGQYTRAATSTNTLIRKVIRKLLPTCCLAVTQ